MPLRAIFRFLDYSLTPKICSMTLAFSHNVGNVSHTDPMTLVRRLNELRLAV